MSLSTCTKLCVRCGNYRDQIGVCYNAGANLNYSNYVFSNVPVRVLTGIPNILYAVLEYLPLTDLKKSRLVCKIWNEEAKRLLRKRTKVILNSSKKLITFYLEKFETQCHVFESFQLVNIHVATPTVQLVFDYFGKHMKSLELRDSDWTVPALEEILLTKAPNLKELIIYGQIPRSPARLFKDYSPEALKPLSKITHLDIQVFDKIAKGSKETYLEDFIVDLLRVLPNLQVVSSREARSMAVQGRALRDKFASCFVNILTESDLGIKLKHLTVVDITLCPWSDLELQKLKSKAFPLKEVSLIVHQKVAISAVSSFLTSIQKTLTKLTLSFSNWRYCSFPETLCLENIEYLCLEWYIGSLDWITRMKKLRKLVLSDININELFAERYNFTMDLLTTFKVFHYETHIIPETIESISRLFPNLTHFTIHKLTDASLVEVYKRMPNLETLHAIDGSFTDSGVTGLPNSELTTNHCYSTVNYFGCDYPRGYYLGSLKHLSRLILKAPNLTNISVFEGICHLPRLRSLTLWSFKLTPCSLHQLIDMNLDYLNTKHGGVTLSDAISAASHSMKGKILILNGLTAPQGGSTSRVGVNYDALKKGFLSHFQ